MPHWDPRGSFSSRCLTFSSLHCSWVESRKKRADGKPSHTRPCSMWQLQPVLQHDGIPWAAHKAEEGQPRARRGLGTAWVVPLRQATTTPQHSRPCFHPAAQPDAADTEPSPAEEFAVCVRCYFPQQCCRWSSKQLSKSGDFHLLRTGGRFKPVTYKQRALYGCTELPCDPAALPERFNLGSHLGRHGDRAWQACCCTGGASRHQAPWDFSPPRASVSVGSLPLSLGTAEPQPSPAATQHQDPLFTCSSRPPRAPHPSAVTGGGGLFSMGTRRGWGTPRQRACMSSAPCVALADTSQGTVTISPYRGLLESSHSDKHHRATAGGPHEQWFKSPWKGTGISTQNDDAGAAAF